MKKERLKVRGRLTSLILSAVLVLMAPLSITVVFSVLLYSYLRKANKTSANIKKRVLLTGGKMTKSLQLARLFHRAGYQVLLAETEKYSCSGHAYSNCVTSFHLLPDQEKGFDEYQRKIVEIVKQIKIITSSSVSVATTAPVCSKTIKFLNENDIRIIFDYIIK